jgi:hypothetical protein
VRLTAAARKQNADDGERERLRPVSLLHVARIHWIVSVTVVTVMLSVTECPRLSEIVIVAVPPLSGVTLQLFDDPLTGATLMTLALLDVIVKMPV